MAVIIEAITVVVRRDAARRVFAGNDAPLAALAPNPSGRQDEHLYAVGFMNQLDAEAFIRRALEPRGLTWTQGDQAVDLTLVDQFTGLFHYTPWLEVGQYPVKGGAVTAAWLTGTEPGALSTHAYWNLKDYLDLSRAARGGRRLAGDPLGRPPPACHAQPRNGREALRHQTPSRPSGGRQRRGSGSP